MKAFRAGEVRLLVATDVVGRGIDVTSISHIINFDIPQSSRRLRPPRRPHRPHGPRGRRVHVRHPRRRRRADADRDAHQPAAEARRDRRLHRRGDRRRRCVGLPTDAHADGESKNARRARRAASPHAHPARPPPAKTPSPGAIKPRRWSRGAGVRLLTTHSRIMCGLCARASTAVTLSFPPASRASLIRRRTPLGRLRMSSRHCGDLRVARPCRSGRRCRRAIDRPA